jgi:hypothetical protein
MFTAPVPEDEDLLLSGNSEQLEQVSVMHNSLIIILSRQPTMG